MCIRDRYENSDFIEKEQPELSEETKELISRYQQDPSEENYFNLREKVIEDYNACLLYTSLGVGRTLGLLYIVPLGMSGHGNIVPFLCNERKYYITLYRP